MKKAVILAAGLGTRMRKADDSATLSSVEAQVAATGVKALVPVDTGSGQPARPFLDYVLTALADADITDVCLVIGPDHQVLRDYYQSVGAKRIRIDFAVQAKPLGTANAVASAEAFCGRDPFLMINSDNYYPAEALRGLAALSNEGVAVFHRRAMETGSNIDPDRIQKFAAVEIDPAGNMSRILEKPSPETLARLGDDIYVSMNCWRFGPAVFDACRTIKPSPRGEFEITDAAQHLIDIMNRPIATVRLDLPVLDLSSRGDIRAVASRLAGVTVRL
jgi:dTDP-glucose pyrophosphorylase